jgi:PKD repeat protein
MHLGWLAVLLMTAMAAACGHSSPAAPTPVAPSPKAESPSVAVRLTVDNVASQDAVAGLSVVAVDASASTGADLQYHVEFGDGTVITDPIARHVYAVPGSYRVTVTVTDAAERTAGTSASVIVASPLGTWLYAGFLSGVRQVEVQRLTLTSQQGLTIHGVLATRGRERSITGQLVADRRIRLVTDDRSEILEGGFPPELRTESSTLTLSAHGAGVEGETFGFTRVVAEPAGAPPDAVLKMRFFSFSAPFAIKQISPIQFDGSTSRGDGLQYFIEFGDGTFSRAVTAVHPIQDVGQYTARLTVVDRFGRSDSEATTYDVLSLVLWDPSRYQYWETKFGEGSEIPVLLGFTAQDGTVVKGVLSVYSDSAIRRYLFSGTVTADGQVQLRVADSNIALIGTLALGPNFLDRKMLLTITGGPYHGERFTLHYRDSYN